MLGNIGAGLCFSVCGLLLIAACAGDPQAPGLPGTPQSPRQSTSWNTWAVSDVNIHGRTATCVVYDNKAMWCYFPDENPDTP